MIDAEVTNQILSRCIASVSGRMDWIAAGESTRSLSLIRTLCAMLGDPSGQRPRPPRSVPVPRHRFGLLRRGIAPRPASPVIALSPAAIRCQSVRIQLWSKNGRRAQGLSNPNLTCSSTNPQICAVSVIFVSENTLFVPSPSAPIHAVVSVPKLGPCGRIHLWQKTDPCCSASIPYRPSLKQASFRGSALPVHQGASAPLRCRFKIAVAARNTPDLM